MNNILEETKFIMNKYKIKANKSLGQNFLIDSNTLEAIVDSGNIEKKDLVIEIGPGLGTLTKYLLEKAGKVICVEIDKNMIQILQDRFSLYDNFEILNQDILKVNLKELINRNKQTGVIENVKVVANLPYYITTPIIMKLLEEELDLESITVMIQKEVADRLIAIPGQKNTGAITYSVYFYAKAEEVLEVSNNCFIPEPEVTSKVIKLKIRKKAPVDVKDKEFMFKIIKGAFMQRRKTLLNALTNAKIFADKQEGAKVLKELNLSENIRAEKLTLQDFANIANYERYFKIIYTYHLHPFLLNYNNKSNKFTNTI